MKDLKWKRVLLKLSGEALVGDGSYGISPEMIKSLALDLKSVFELNIQLWQPGNNYYDSLVDVGALQQSTSLSVNEKMSGPLLFNLYQNFPNPFNSNTSINVYSDTNKDVLLYLNDINGRLVKVLLDNKKSKGFKTIHWSGTNDLGIKVQSGIYFYTLEIGGFKETKKMLLLK